jgi:hypothetical protein
MNQSEALNLAIEMLDRVAHGRNCDAREYYERLRDIKAASPAVPEIDTTDLAPAGAAIALLQTVWPRTAIVDGEEYYEIGRQTIEGRDLILMESCRDGGEAPALIIEAVTGETVMGEVLNGFQEYLDEEASTSQVGGG